MRAQLPPRVCTHKLGIPQGEYKATMTKAEVTDALTEVDQTPLICICMVQTNNDAVCCT